MTKKSINKNLNPQSDKFIKSTFPQYEELPEIPFNKDEVEKITALIETLESTIEQNNLLNS